MQAPSLGLTQDRRQRSPTRGVGLLIGILIGLAGCAPTFPDSPDLTAVIETFEQPTGDLFGANGGELAARFLTQRQDSADVIEPIEQAEAVLTTSVASIALPGAGFIQITRTCDTDARGQAGQLRATLVVLHDTINTTAAIKAHDCLFGTTLVDGGIEVDISSDQWFLASLDVSIWPASQEASRRFAGALRVCRDTGESCQRGDTELSLTLGATETFVIAYRRDAGVLSLRDVNGTWACARSQPGSLDARCTFEQREIMLPGVNPAEMP